MNVGDAKNARPPIKPRWQSGDVSLTRIVESEGPLLSPFELLPDCTPDHIASNLSWLAPRFYAPEAALLVITIQSFLIRAAGKAILVDACSGDHKTGAAPSSTAANGDGWRNSKRLVCTRRTSISCCVRICTWTMWDGIRVSKTGPGCQHFPMPAI